MIISTESRTVIQETPVKNILRLFWLAVITAHVVLAAGWWWMMPSGFPVSHPRFWVNGIFPIATIAAGVAARWLASRRDGATGIALLAMFPAAWICGAIAARLIFPISFRHLWLLAFAPGLVMLAALWPQRRALVERSLMAGAFAAAASFIAIFGVWAQRGGEPATHPLNRAMPAIPADPSPPQSMRTVRLSDTVGVEPAMAVVNVQTGQIYIAIQPLLTFVSRSPDRCWILFATRADRSGPMRNLINLSRDSGQLNLTYRNDTFTTLGAKLAGENVVEIEAAARLSEPIYSHLNTYCELTITGHRKLEISFSPCSSERIEVTYGEYPRGKPRRCAFLSADGNFRVVEAASGEKGPFRTLAQGRLDRVEPLTMTLYDESVAVAEIQLDDFASQADTSLSPTAGWGLPCNAIEFALQDDSPRSAAGVFISLSGTSVGRGYDTVGHSPGNYRNRMRIRALATPGAD